MKQTATSAQSGVSSSQRPQRRLPRCPQVVDIDTSATDCASTSPVTNEI